MAQFNFRMPTIRSAAGAMAIAMIATSVVVALVKPLEGYVLLVPDLVVRGFVWQLLTYALVEVTPLGVIFGALILWNLGGMVEFTWGRKRFLWFSVGISVLAGLATVLVSLLVPALVREAYPGGMVLTGALWVAYGLQIGRGQTNFWGAAITGNVLAMIGAGFVFLNAAFAGLSTVIPEAFALLFTYFYMRGAQPSLLWLRFRSWQLDRDLKKRSAHLRGIDGGRRNVGGDSDKYLH
ncbi:MAG TPA: rhomboid family intramembrane serine protease [Archangium sp.]